MKPNRIGKLENQDKQGMKDPRRRSRRRPVHHQRLFLESRVRSLFHLLHFFFHLGLLVFDLLCRVINALIVESEGGRWRSPSIFVLGEPDDIIDSARLQEWEGVRPGRTEGGLCAW